MMSKFVGSIDKFINFSERKTNQSIEMVIGGCQGYNVGMGKTLMAIIHHMHSLKDGSIKLFRHNHHPHHWIVRRTKFSYRSQL